MSRFLGAVKEGVLEMGILNSVREWRRRRVLVGNFKALHRYLANNGWQYEGDAERQVLHGDRVPNEAEDAVSFDVGYTEMNMYSLMTLKLDVPKERVSDIAELICRMNPGTIAGHFEFDISDRKIRYRVKIPHEDFHHNAWDKTDRMMMFPVIMLLLGKPAFIKVIQGGGSVDDAFREYEGGDVAPNANR